jgi:group II intron reverse transcriptase/maturase
MNGKGKSDDSIVPKKPVNKGPAVGRRKRLSTANPAERMEERESTKGNPTQQTRFRTQSREDLQHALRRIRESATRDKRQQFTSLWHHVYNPERLREEYFLLKRHAAPGVDGATWQEYGRNLEENMENLSDRLQRGAYHAQPVKRTHIPKTDGRQRPIGIPTLEDKIVQRASVSVMQAVYEADFKGFSYGFRPGRDAHQAIDALAVGIAERKVNWVLDADIRGFFDAIDHEWMMKFVEHRIADRRMGRHVKKWLRAGVMENGKMIETKVGTPQGGSISPLLANIYLHYVFDLWANQWRKRFAVGDMIIVRYADDCVPRMHERRFYNDLSKTPECNAARKMRVGPSKPPCRRRLQTTLSCAG